MNAKDFKKEYDKALIIREKEEIRLAEEKEIREKEELEKSINDSRKKFEDINGFTIEAWCDDKLQDFLNGVKDAENGIILPMEISTLPYKLKVMVIKEVEVGKFIFKRTVEVLESKELELDTAIGRYNSRRLSLFDYRCFREQTPKEKNERTIRNAKYDCRDRCYYENLKVHMVDYFMSLGFESKVIECDFFFFSGNLEIVQVNLPKEHSDEDAKTD